jgi:putative nucleotidyltransferase with HDIG domain
MPSRRPSPLVIAAQGAGLALAAGLIIRLAPSANWDLALFGVLLALSALSDLTAAPTSYKVRISGSFLAIVVAMVYLGGAPAALLGVLTIVIGSIRWREASHYFLNNLFTYAWFPLIAGQLFHVASDSFGLSPSEASFYAAVFALFILALVLNFTMIAAYGCYAERLPFRSRVGTALIPVLPSELAAAVMAVGVAYLYHQVGLGAIALFGVVLVTFQYLLGALLVSQQRAEELERRTTELASFQVGMLGALLRTLDLRDRMTARHSAAVARYARAIAGRAGMSQRDQELVHVAGLLHDIGKVVLPDHILKANVPLSDEDWMLIRRHPQQGARVVASVDGYGPIADIILAHHERIDGTGYPRRLTGTEIPAAARIISVADTYDVMTARDSYREPTSSFEAIQELQRVAGTQLDQQFVEIFVELLEGKDLDFRHGVDADFEEELSLEARVEHLARPGGERHLARMPS